MAPITQDHTGYGPAPDNGVLSGEEVVISGISGLFPKSDNVKEFMDNLYNKVDMVGEHDMMSGHLEMPKYMGQISGKTKFDAQFFRVTHTQASTLEPMTRMLMEQAYGAMYDAGINPFIYTGKRIAVLGGSSYEDSANALLYGCRISNIFSVTGASKTMKANRISYWLDGNSPSYVVDCGCTSSSVCLEQAHKGITTGLFDAALVVSCQICTDPRLFNNLEKFGVLCSDGKTKCFDKNGDGYVRSESINVIFLQKAKDAKRIYAEVYHAQSKYGLKPNREFQQFRESKEIESFLNNFYSEAGVSPSFVEYVEANGTATPEADANELQAVGRVFGSAKPVKVGCVKSNMGNSEPASGNCALVKLCLAYHKGKLPGNLHYADALNIPVVKDGQVQVLTESTHFDRGFTAINNFAFAGNNSHVLLKGHYKPKDTKRYQTNIPRLIVVSGRQEKSVKKIFGLLKAHPLDPELIGLLHNIYQVDTPGFTSRGYTVLVSNDKNETISVSESVGVHQGGKRPLWLVFSGMGSQGPGMGADLMRIPTFSAAIEKCHEVLKPRGIDIVKILTDHDSTIFNNILNCFLGIAAMQIGLVDVLKEMEIVPDYIIGHSLGEIGCAYFDGGLTTEQMILAAYARGLVSVNTEFIKGSMAAVGLGYKDMLPLCPPEIDIACHNSSTSCTISGPVDSMTSFVAELTAKGIFAKEVPCGQIAYHSRYIQHAGNKLLHELRKIIAEPVARSDKWISTSVSEEKWDEPILKLSGPEYHTNNLLSPVYFEEAAKLIPSNAVIVEVAPHGLMQAILKRSHRDCIHIPLTKRGNSDSISFLLEAIGKLYQEGYNPRIDVLYPKIEFPVSTETSLLSHFVDWYHEVDWFVPFYGSRRRIVKSSRKVVISMQDDEYKFIAGHVKEGNIVLPEAAILVLVWETLAMYNELKYDTMNVIFRDVHFHGAVIIDLEDNLTLHININKGSEYFEVTSNDVLVASGYIAKAVFLNLMVDSDHIGEEDNVITLNSDDVYSFMAQKGYSYQREFRSIHSLTQKWNDAKLKWTGNWVTFLDSLIQLNTLARKHDGISIPKIIKTLKIYTSEQKNHEIMVDTCLRARRCETSDVIKCGGVEMRNVIFNDLPKLPNPEVLETKSYSCNDSVDTIGQMDYNLVNTVIGDIETLSWATKNNPDCFEDSIQVCFAGPSIRDVQKAVGIIKSENKDFFGMDYSGIDKKGNRMMGLIPKGAISSSVQPDKDLLWPVPDHWTLKEAATVPLPYAHAYYCLSVKGELRRGQSVFVSGGAGALGQAVISICLSLDCLVYTTVGDLSKKIFLMQLFPGLNENRIGYSYDASFYNNLVLNMKKSPCDFVISCLSGPLREMTMKCTGANGVFLDVNKYDMKQDTAFGMHYLKDCKNYKTVNLSSIFKYNNTREKKLLQTRISDGIASGTVRPLSHVVLPPQDISRAFRLLSLNKQRGRVLIRLRDSQTTPDLNLTFNSKKTKSQFLGSLARILGVKDIDTVDEYISVKNLVSNELVTEQLRFTIRQYIKIDFSAEDVRKMTFGRLRTLGDVKVKQNTKFNSGLKAFFNFIDHEENIPCDDFVAMPTMLSSSAQVSNIVLPEAAILVLVWETLAMYNELKYDTMNVIFRDVHFHGAVIIDLEDNLTLHININKGSEYFEVTSNDVLVASGYIAKAVFLNLMVDSDHIGEEDNVITLNSDDVYSFMAQKGYSYQREFRSIHSLTQKWNDAKLKWTGNWVTFLDSLIQLNTLARKHDGISIPKIIKTLKIYTSEQKNHEIMVDTCLRARRCETSDVIKCGGVEMRNVIFNDLPKLPNPEVLETKSYSCNDSVDTIGQMDYNLVNTVIGDIETLSWATKNNPDCFEDSIQVCFAGPSIRDVQKAVGIIKSENKDFFGMDYSGIDKKGNRMMGLIPKGAISSSVQPDKDLLWPVPDHWTLKEAATVPLPYAHAYYCLSVKGELRRGQSVFVSGGAGALGQAVISICLSLDCLVYTTVGDLSKKIFLMQLFPGLNENRIGYSYDASFYNNLVLNMKKSPCDFVISCLSGPLREMTMKCTGANGVFLDVNKYDMKQDTAFGMHYLKDCKNYKTVNLSSIFKYNNTREKKLLQTRISDGIASGTVRPLSHVVLPPQDISRAFRLLSLNKQRGRVLIRLRDSQTTPDLNLTFNSKKTKSQFLGSLARILGVKDIDTVDEYISVKNLVSNELVTEQLRFTIRQYIKIDFSAEDVRKMTFGRLRTLGDVKVKQNTKFNSGLKAFFNFIDHEENIPCDDFVAMPTMLSSSAQGNEGIDADTTYLMMFPGFEGNDSVFKKISESLKIQAATILLEPDVINESIHNIAVRIKKEMNKRLKLKSKFLLLGYSFGINVALEIAALLEKDGLVGVVYCLDSSPDALRVQIDAYLDKPTHVELQNTLIEQLYFAMSGQKCSKLKEDIEKLDNWPEKIEACVNRLKKLQIYTTQYKRSIFEAAYQRIMLARNYNPNFKLDSELILIKGIPHPQAEELPFDYNLSEYTNKPVKVFDIQSDFASAPNDSRVANIINQNLDPDLIKDFKRKNLCETYLTYPSDY